MNTLNDKVLVLNRNWQAIAETTVQTALCDMCRGAATGIDSETLLAVKWDDWAKLPIREGDRFIGASQERQVRVPAVICKVSYDRIPKKRLKNNNRGIRERDKAICQVTNEYAPDGTVDHLHSKANGNKLCFCGSGRKLKNCCLEHWTNKVWMKKELNNRKGSLDINETTYRLIRAPKVPVEIPVTLSLRRRPDKPEWDMFLPV